MAYSKFLEKKNPFNADIFLRISSSFVELGFSSRINYMFFKRKFYRYSLLTTNTKSMNLKFRLTRFNVKHLNNSAVLPGFYRAV